jgi:SAM-dependent methyltransferase
VPPGARVLDVATGRGAVLFAAAERVGPGGRVLGVDLSDGMVRETAREIARAGLAKVAVRRMDAEQLDLADGSFDVAFCSFALFFFPRPRVALAEMRRVLRPGGTLGIAYAEQNDPRWRWQNELFGTHAVFEPPPAGVLQGPALRRPGALADLLAACGFAGAREVREQATFVWRDAAEWWEALWTHGTRRAVESMSPDALARFRAEALAELRRLEREDGLSERFEPIFWLASKG